MCDVFASGGTLTFLFDISDPVQFLILQLRNQGGKYKRHLLWAYYIPGHALW